MLKGVTVGCGFFSRIQMEAWQRVDRAHIAAACDVDAAKAQNFAVSFNLKPYTKLKEMLDAEKPDFVDIATRPATHLDLVRYIAARGFPILLQKPVAETWEDAKRIVRLVHAAGVPVMINENWRWQRWYREIAGFVHSGKIGQPFSYLMQMRYRDGVGNAPFPNQPYFKEMPRFLIFESLVHLIDTARFLFGDIEEIYCRTNRLNPNMRGEDMAQILTQHASGVQGVIDGNRTAYPDEIGPALDIARFEGYDGTLRLFHTGKVFLNDEQVFNGQDLPGYRGDSCRATQQHFVDCVEMKQPFETDLDSYVAKTFAAVEACYLSAKENRPVKVKEVAETL